MKKIRMSVAVVGLTALLAVSGIQAANAVTQSLGAKTCAPPGYIFISSITIGETSHTVWSSINDYQGKTWPGTGAWKDRSLASTKRTSSANYVTAPTIYQTAVRGCYVNI